MPATSETRSPTRLIAAQAASLASRAAICAVESTSPHEPSCWKGGRGRR